MTNTEKFCSALTTVKGSGVEVTWTGEINTEEDFNKIKWKTGVAENGITIDTLINPHSEITWDLVKAEMDRLQAEYDAQDYARKRKEEYPTIEELVVALYDTDDKVAIDEKRAAVKLKHPKGA
tara:strand:+ start:553 stop:921 length:369 start_codon:yes stop_codon:yes gene_type:complete